MQRLYLFYPGSRIVPDRSGYIRIITAKIESTQEKPIILTFRVSEFSIEEVFWFDQDEMPCPVIDFFRKKLHFVTNICPGTSDAKVGITDILFGYANVGAIAMIDWFTRKKRKREIEKLERLLVDKLSPFHPNMADIYKQAKLSTILPVTSPQPFIQLLHEINGPYYEKNRKKHKDYYVLNGIEIKRKNSDEFVEVPIEVNWDLVSRIEIDKPNDFWKYYEPETLRVRNLSRTDIRVSNEDEEKLKRILKAIDSEQIKKLEVEDTFEIQLDDRKFYTILNMEDGNYIAVDQKRHVFRLNHDSNAQVRLIDKSVDNFLRHFSGDKKELEKYFDN